MFKRFKVRTKFIFWFSVIQVTLFSAICVVIGYSVYRYGETEIADFRRAEVQKVKAELKNYVDIAYVSIKANHERHQDRDYLIRQYGRRLVDIIDVVESMIDERLAMVAAGEVTADEARGMAVEDLKKLRYDKGTGYVWINDMGAPIPKMIMHPTLPALDGQLLDDPKFNCAYGTTKNLFQAFVDVCRDKGEGYVDYLWPKPTKDGLTERQPKLSYVRLIKEWGWVVGTGVYVDDAVRDGIAKSLADVADMRYDNGVGYFWINDMGAPIPKMIMHPTLPALDGRVLDDPKFNCAYGTDKNLFQAFVDVCRDKGEGYVDYLWPKPTQDGLTAQQPKMSFVRLYEPLQWVIGTGVYIDDIDAAVAARQREVRKQIWRLIQVILIFLVLALLLAGLLIYVVTSRIIIRPLAVVRRLTEAVEKGDLDVRFGQDRGDEVADLGRALDDLTDRLRGRATLASAIAIGDLTEDVPLASDRDTLGIALRDMMEGLRCIVGELQETASLVSSGAAQTADASEGLSAGASEQAASIEEISSTMTEVGDRTRSNAENAAQAQRLTEEAHMAAVEGGKHLHEMIAAMEEMNRSSREISTVIKTIDDIASQTNLLALNAAVEAARAGKQGLGFAVVAKDVRLLAGRSSKAAQETTELIEASVGRIEKGIAIVQRLSKSFDGVVDGVSRAAIISADIAAVSDEQSANIAQINVGLGQVERITQSSTSRAEQTATTSEELFGQASRLQTIVSRFRLDPNAPLADDTLARSACYGQAGNREV